MESAVHSELVARAKAAIREKMIRERNKLDERGRSEKSRRIARRLLELEAFRKSEAVLFFLSLPQEVQTGEMIQEAFRLNKEVFVPLVDKENEQLRVARIPSMEIEFVRGEYGIREPAPKEREIVPPSRLDLVVAPGLAFDPSGGRIGYGVGFYDRLLNRVPDGTPRVGIGFDFQVLDSVPQADYDVPVQFVVSESQSLRCLPSQDAGG